MEEPAPICSQANFLRTFFTTAMVLFLNADGAEKLRVSLAK
jgi:hypothetical protein